MKFLLFILSMLIFNNSAQSQAAQQFWLAPPDVSDLHDAPGGEPLYLILTPTGGVASTVTIDQPANGSFTPIVVTVDPAKPKRVNLTAFKTFLETRPTNTICNTGIRITATQPVSATYIIANASNSDYISLKGQEALGNYFYVPLHKYSPFNNEPSFAAPHQAFSSFDVVATQNATDVRIYSPVPVDGHPANQQFQITLNAGQTYSCGFTGASWTVPGNHPSGAVILSNKPVAVAIKGDSEHNPSGGCYDLQAEQIVPVSQLGNDHIAVKSPLNNTGDESVFIMAVTNGTDIYINNATTPITKLFAGESFRIDIDSLNTSSNNAILIHATSPVYAIHYAGFGCEMGDALLPPLSVKNSTISFTRNDAQTFQVNLVCRTSDINNFTMAINATGTINPAAFLPVPGTPYSAARIQFNTTQFPVDSLATIQNPGGFLCGVMSGGTSTGANYTYYNSYTPANVVALRSLQLSGSSRNGVDELFWKATEDGYTYQYELQQKTSTGWDAVFTQNTSGNYGEKSFQYSQPQSDPGTAYYRVQVLQRDNGHTSYSNIVALQRSAESRVNVHPNPASGELFVTLTGNAEQRIYMLYDAGGRLVRQTSGNGNRMRISLRSLSRGSYLLKIKGSEGEVVKQVVVE